MKRITIFAIRACVILLLLSCVNTSYSRLDEKQIKDEVLDLILGQFPHHGPAFYQYEEKRNKEILTQKPEGFEARNDLAVAYLKQAKWELAQTEFDKNEKLHPGKYKTAANLGVMYKKMGEYEKAAHFIAKSLKIKPEGHMGLGDYYLKMAHWLNEGNEQNFLGIAYNATPKQIASAANRQHIVTLIKNDYSFADAYLVLGDILYTEGNHQLAMRAYFRAQSLGIPVSKGDINTDSPKIAKFKNVAEHAYQRLEMLASEFKAQAGALTVVDSRGAFNQFSAELEGAENWLTSFHNTEAKLISEGVFPSFELTLKKMENSGNEKPKVIEAMSYSGVEYDSTYIFFIFILLSVPIALFIMFKVFLSNSKKQAKAKLHRLKSRNS
jgi:tetratricopeptide (TPR) repeat protein